MRSSLELTFTRTLAAYWISAMLRPPLPSTAPAVLSKYFILPHTKCYFIEPYNIVTQIYNRKFQIYMIIKLLYEQEPYNLFGMLVLYISTYIIFHIYYMLLLKHNSKRYGRLRPCTHFNLLCFFKTFVHTV